MEQKHQVHNLIILDESGSMAGISKTIMEAFNELVQTIRGVEAQYPEQEHRISFLTFNGLGRKWLHFDEPAASLGQIDDGRYKPQASTPLYDAMGFALGGLRSALEGRGDHNVLVTIMTDGEENASRERKGGDIRELVEELKGLGWTFTYVGADHDVEGFARTIAINNTFIFEKTKEDIGRWMSTERKSRARFSENIRLRETTTDYFVDSINPQK